VRELIGQKQGHDEVRWTAVQQVGALQKQVRKLVQNEPDEIRIWARIHLGRERRVVVAKAFGYRDGSGVTHLLKAIERRAVENNHLAEKLKSLKCAFSSFKS